MPKHSVHWKNSVDNFIEKPYHQATKDVLMEAIPTFQGSSLIVLGNIVQVRTYILCVQKYVHNIYLHTYAVLCTYVRTIYTYLRIYD